MSMLFKSLRRFMPFMDAEGGTGGGTGSTSQEGGTRESNQSSGEKTFTQAELNSILANEKRKNTASFYESLGFKDAEETKAFVTKYREQEEKNKSDLTKAEEKAANLEKEKAAELQKAQWLEYKFKVVEQGCSVQTAEDVVTLAMGKVTTEKDFDTALKEIKEAYPTMFEAANSNQSNTGSGGNPPRRQANTDSSGIGKRLAEQRKANLKNIENNPYFKN